MSQGYTWAQAGLQVHHQCAGPRAVLVCFLLKSAGRRLCTRCWSDDEQHSTFFFEEREGVGQAIDTVTHFELQQHKCQTQDTLAVKGRYGQVMSRREFN